jgi:glycerol-3-phosphate acyltransferase PlsY
VLGHNWMLFLRFTGGKGMGPAIGAIAVLLPVYGHALGLAYFLGTILVLIIITRNVALAMGVALLALPFISWFGMHSLEFLIFTIVLGLTIAVRFFPTAMRAAARSKSAREFIFDRWQRHKQPPD